MNAKLNRILVWMYSTRGIDKYIRNNSLIVLVAILLIVPSLIWIFIDQSVWPWDMAWYAEVTVDLWYTLVNDPFNWPQAMSEAFKSKAPGIAWLGQFFVPIGCFFGSIETGLLLSSVLLQGCTLFLVGKIVQKIAPEKPLLMLCAMSVMASAPLFIGMSHQFLTEALQLFSVTYFYWIAVHASNIKPLQIFGHLSLATGLAILAKASSPIYCLLPGIIAIYYMVKGLSAKEEFSLKIGDILFLSTGLVVLISALVWYGYNFQVVIDFAKLASSSEVALEYGTARPFLHKLTYWIEVMQKSFVTQEFLVLIVTCLFVGAVLFLKQLLRNSINLTVTKEFIVLVAAFFHIVGVLALLSSNLNEEQRYVFSLLPSFIIIFVILYSKLPDSILLIVVVFALIQFTYMHQQAYGLIEHDPAISHWLRSNKDEELKKIELAKLESFTCTRETAGRAHMVGIELNWLNYNTLAFYSAKARLKRDYRCLYVYLGHAEKSEEKAWERMKYNNIYSYISLLESEHPDPPDFLNQVSLPMLTRVRDDPNYVLMAFDSQYNVLVFGDERKWIFGNELKWTFPDESKGSNLCYSLGEIARSDLTVKEKLEHGVSYETVVVFGLDGIALHPLPPSVGKPTVVELQLDWRSNTRCSETDQYRVSAVAHIENETSGAVRFHLEVRSGLEKDSSTTDYSEITIKPADGRRLLEVTSASRPKSLVLSTIMAAGEKNNYSAHAKFSNIQISVSK